jgi:hypothetical protein
VTDGSRRYGNFSPLASQESQTRLEPEMKPRNSSYRLFFCVIAIALCGFTCLAAAQTAPTRSPKGPGKIVVRPKFGGPISGYDIDQNGTEGVLTEFKPLKNGYLSAVETFDQKTGKILKVIAKTDPGAGDVLIGIVGTSTAIVEHEQNAAHGTKRTWYLISPLDANKYTGLWHPPHFDNNDFTFGVSRDQGAAHAAFIALHNIYPGPTNFAFSEDVAKNTFGKEIVMTNPNFVPFSEPAFAFDVKTNTGVLASEGGGRESSPKIGLVNLVTGKFRDFPGLGTGGVYGIAVDSDDGIACTTTGDANVEFYDLKAETGSIESLPGGGGQPQSGFDVEFDPIHKLFLIFQASGIGDDSYIQVYDPKGNLVDSIDFGPRNHYGGYIALQPKQRSGFLGEDAVIRSFTY